VTVEGAECGIQVLALENQEIYWKVERYFRIGPPNVGIFAAIAVILVIIPILPVQLMLRYP
jgi:hypothetical protein